MLASLCSSQDVDVRVGGQTLDLCLKGEDGLDPRVQEGPGVSRRVQEGPGGPGRVRGGPGRGKV